MVYLLGDAEEVAGERWAGSEEVQTGLDAEAGGVLSFEESGVEAESSEGASEVAGIEVPLGVLEGGLYGRVRKSVEVCDGCEGGVVG